MTPEALRARVDILLGYNLTDFETDDLADFLGTLALGLDAIKEGNLQEACDEIAEAESYFAEGDDDAEA